MAQSILTSGVVQVAGFAFGGTTNVAISSNLGEELLPPGDVKSCSPYQLLV